MEERLNTLNAMGDQLSIRTITKTIKEEADQMYHSPDCELCEEFKEVEVMERLVGKKILALEISEDKTVLRFITDHGECLFMCCGDCCAQCWVEQINGVSCLIGEVVNEAKTKEYVRQEVLDSYGDCIDDFGYTLVTSKGYVDFDLRASHNGYYGGELMDYTEVNSYQRDWFNKQNFKFLTVLEDF